MRRLGGAVSAMVLGGFDGFLGSSAGGSMLPVWPARCDLWAATGSLGQVWLLRVARDVVLVFSFLYCTAASHTSVIIRRHCDVK